MECTHTHTHTHTYTFVYISYLGDIKTAVLHVVQQFVQAQRGELGDEGVGVLETTLGCMFVCIHVCMYVYTEG